MFGQISKRVNGACGWAATVAIVGVLTANANMALAQCESTQREYIEASDRGASDMFGNSVAISGNVAVIAANQDDGNTGAAYVFRHDGNQWVEEAKLTASDATQGDFFGGSVGIDGDLIIVGAWKNEGEAGGDLREAGAAYVFRYDGANWNEEIRLLAHDTRRFDRYGVSVAISGNVVVVGASYDDDPNLGTQFNSGSAYIYRHNGANWNLDNKVTASDAAGDDLFAATSAASGDVIVLGCYNDNALTGAAYVFRYDGANWAEETKLMASDATAGDLFGVSVAASNDAIAVGAWKNEGEGGGDLREAGAAYIFRFDGLDWSEEARLLAGDARRFDRFGASVAIDGDMALVGASFDDDPLLSGVLNTGSVYVYRHDGANWNWEAKLVASNPVAGDHFGNAAAISGPIAMIGSREHDAAGFDSGAAYAYTGISDCNGAGGLDLCEMVANPGLDADNNGILDECESAGEPGDLNCDGEINAFDIEPFLSALFDPAQYAIQYPDCDINLADINGDGTVDAFDIEPFLGILFP